MSRLCTWGFETGGIGTGQPEGSVNSGGTNAVITSAVARTGTYSLKCDSGASNVTSAGARGGGSNDIQPVASATNFFRAYFRFDNLPNSIVSILAYFSDNTISVRLTPAGKIQLYNSTAATQIGSDSSATIVADATTWYRIELSITVNATPQVTACEAQLDGVSVASTSGLTLATTIASALFDYGWRAVPGANKVLYIDDCAMNVSTGSAQTSWPGPGNAVLLIPTADSAVGTGWTLGTGTAITANAGSTAVKNIPPLGVADLTAGSDTKQIRNASSNANVNYDATMTTYTAAGVPSGATINVVTPLSITSAAATTSAKQGTLGIVSNPTVANVALGASGTAGAFVGAAAAGNYPGNWKWSQGTITHAPTVTLGTAPVTRITQVTASTRIAMVCFMGIYVDYTPAAAVIPDVGMALTVT